MVSCVACGISHKARKQGIQFHRFPKNPEQRQAWLNFINRDENSIPKICYLCSNHFEEQDFDRTSSLKVQLKKSVVPSRVVSRMKYARITADNTSIQTHFMSKLDCSENLVKPLILSELDISNIEELDYNAEMPEAEMAPDINCTDFMNESRSEESSENLAKNVLCEPDLLKTEELDCITIKIENVECSSEGEFERYSKAHEMSHMEGSTDFFPGVRREKLLKAKIRQLTIKDLYKSKQIRKLQKANWAQKRRIIELNNVIKELLEKKFTNVD